MAIRGDILELMDFSGGRNSFDPEYLVSPNQAIDLQNINLLDRGFKKRYGNTAFNSSAMVDATTAVAGIGYMKFISTTEFLNAVAGTKFFTSTGMSGTMADTTGAITITAGQNNLWTPVRYNDLQIWFGGAPDAPFKYSGSGNATALGGTPPSAKTAFVANNRIFAISTAANPSRIQWHILSNPEDWTGTGSGNADVAKNDGEDLLSGIPLSSDAAILFKNSSTHLMIMTRSPFPIYQLQKGVGSAGRYSAVNVNGTIYFVTPSRRMKSTSDGVTFQDFPNTVNDLWDNVNTTRIPYITGQYYPTLDQIHWFCSMGSSTTNDASIIWDIRRKCWLYNPTGFKANVSCLVQERRMFTGHYNGKVFEQDRTGVYTDASEDSPSAIDAFWRGAWFKGKGLTGVIHPQVLAFSCLSESASTIDVSYGFDFEQDRTSKTFSLVTASDVWDTALWGTATWGGANSLIRRIFIAGRGNTFNYRFRNATASQGFTFQGASLTLRPTKAMKTTSLV
jgi:hypothetical protein